MDAVKKKENRRTGTPAGDSPSLRLRILLATTLVLTIGWSSTSTEARLSGCPTPTSIADALAKLQQNSWQKVSSQQVTAIWPSRFDELTCESEIGCRLLVSKNRVIGGHCECCEAFVFHLERKEDGSRNEYLDNIIIHYSAQSKAAVIDAAKKLAHGAGLPESRIATVGTDKVQRYEWTDSRERIRQSYILEVQLTSVGRNWELYLSIGADAI